MHVDYSEIDYNRVTAEEVDILLREGEMLAPVMAQTYFCVPTRACVPLVASDNDPSGRNVSRGIVLLDHAERDGMDGLSHYRRQADDLPADGPVATGMPSAVNRQHRAVRDGGTGPARLAAIDRKTLHKVISLLPQFAVRGLPPWRATDLAR